MAAAFSIIVPTFNSAAVLADAIESVARQGRQDVEVLIIDGASTDDTVAVARRFAGLVTQVVSEPDRGIYDAINKGLALAQGELVGVLGSDDRYAAGALDRVAAAAGGRPSGLYAGDALMIAADGSSSIRVDEDYGPGALVSGIPFNHNAMFAARDALAAVGVYSLTYRICADANWVHRAIRAGVGCTRVDAVLVEFGLEGTSSTDPQRILAETYATIVENFPCLDTDEAERVFRAVRGWSGGEDVPAILARHRAHPDFLIAVAQAFQSRARRLAQAAAARPAGSVPAALPRWRARAGNALRRLVG